MMKLNHFFFININFVICDTKKGKKQYVFKRDFSIKYFYW